MTRDRAATLAFLVMEALVFYVVVSLLARGAGGNGPNVLTVIVAMLVGFGFARLLQRFDVSPVPLAIGGAVVTILALTILLNVQYNTGANPLSFGWLTGFADSPDGFLQTRWPQTWGVIIVTAVWLRAVIAAQHELSYPHVLLSFSIGLVIFVVALIFGQGSRIHDHINYSALPFFICGLIALALLQLRRAGEPDSDVTHGPWIAVVLGTVGTLTLLSAVLGFFPLGFFYWLLRPLGILLLRVLDIVIYLIALPIGWLVTFLIVRVFGRNFEMPVTQEAATQVAEEAQRQGERGALLGFLLVVFKFLFVLAVLAIAAYIIYRVFRYLRRREQRAEEVRESVEREGSLGEDLNALWRGMLGRFNRPRARLQEPELPDGARRVRRLYLDLLDDAETRGTVRRPPATPHEFAPDLSRAYVGPAPERLTERFAAARYGRVSPSREEVAALERDVNEAKRKVT
jgi:hypothetical protein